MRILNLNFIKNTSIFPYKKKPVKNNYLATLCCDTVSFGTISQGKKLTKNHPYSAHQRDVEIETLTSALNNAIDNSKCITEQELSIQTGIDISVVNLRLSTNKKLKLLFNRMKALQAIKNEKQKEVDAKTLEEFFNILSFSGKKLTESEISFYVGFEKDRLLTLISEFPEVEALSKVVIMVPDKYGLVEKRTQKSTIKNLINYKIGNSSRQSYESIAEKTGLDISAIRSTLNENYELFCNSIAKGIYPPDFYSEKEIESLDDNLMNVMLYCLKNNAPFDIDETSRELGTFSGVVEKRLNCNSALREAYNRILGIDEDED